MIESVVGRGLDGLRDVVSGEVLADGDLGYAEAGRVVAVDGRPRVVVRCAAAGDVVAALRYAEAQDLPVAVRSGGHHAAGFGTNDGGVVIDVRPMDEVRVLPDDVVRVGTGATWGAVAARLSKLGLAISSGDTASVGVGGLMAGGGIGWVVRKHGLAIDNVVSAEVVTADGSVRRVDAANEPELFWGLRGAAGSLGVVTSYDITAVRQPTVHFGTLLYPWTQTEQVLKAWTEYAASAPENLTSSLQLAPTMMADRQVPVAVMVCVAGDPAVLEPLRNLGTLLTDKVAEVPYAEVFSDMSMPADWRPRIRNGFFDTWSPELTDRLLEARQQIPAMAMEIRALGGAFGAMPADATAFAHRGAQFMVNSVLMGSPEAQGAQQPKDFDAFWQTLRPNGAYVNFLSNPTDADLDSCYPESHRTRLAALKQTVDPGHVFRSAISVPPRPEWTGGRRHLMRWAMRSRR